MLGHLAMLSRIATGAALGGVIGYERHVHRRPVGLRTHLLVSMASATFMVVSTQFAFYQAFPQGGGVEVDASRIAASVVSAVGFLGGGAILRNGGTVHGLTTAAGLWLVTAIGLCAGAGMFVEAGFVTTLGVLALTVLRRFEDKNDALVHRQLQIVADAAGVEWVMAQMRALGITVRDVEFEREFGGDGRNSIAFDAHVPASITPDRLVQALESANHVRSVKVRSAA